MNDVYYNPEAFGLEVVAEIDFSDGNYCFDLRVVWLHRESGRLLTARDAGCSCPSPFEDYCSVESLEPLDFGALRREVQEDSYCTTAEDRADFLRKVRNATRRKAVRRS